LLSPHFCVIFKEIASSLHISAKKLTRIRALLSPVSAPSFIFLVLLIVSPAISQPRIFENGQRTLGGADAGLHLDTQTRSKIDLAGIWQYTVDEENWSQVKVPSSFDYQGKIAFQRKFSVSKELLSNSAFKFVAFGINNEAEIFVNDVFVGKHVGGYTSFELEIPESALQIGPENTIRIMVNNRLNSRLTLPVRKQVWGWRNYGGILRDIYILVTPRVWIDVLRLKVSIDSVAERGYVDAVTTINTASSDLIRQDSGVARSRNGSFALVLEVVDRNSNAVVGQSPPQTVTIGPSHIVDVSNSLTVKSPRPWSPEYPELYILRAVLTDNETKQKVVIDEYALNFGFRNVRIEGTSIVVNGRNTQLKGVVWHEDYPGKGASLTYEEMERDVALMKAMGVNAIRFAFHAPHPYMLNLCSRYGLFAFEELPVWNVSGEILGEDSFQIAAEEMIREMVQRDHPNPAVLAWGIGNDFDSSSEEAVRFVERAARLFRSLDTRPLYAGTRLISTDKCASLVDIAAVNLSASDPKSFKSLLTAWKAAHNRQPVILLGYGKEVDHSDMQGWYDPLSQQAQARFFLLHYAIVRESGIAGSFVSSFADWTGDRPILTVNVGDPYVHPVGLVSQRRERRLAYEMVRAQYGDEKTSALPPGSQKTKFPVAHVLAGFLVIILLGYQYAYNRRFSDAVKRALARSYNFYSDLRDFRAVSLMQTLLLSVMISLTLADVLSGVFYHYRTDKFFDFVLTYFVVSDFIKEVFIHATWNPLQGIVFFTVVFLLLSLFVSLVIKLSSLIVRTKIHWYHAYGVTVWSAMPIVFLSPVAMSLFKVMENPLYVLPSIAVILAFLVWTLLRMISGIAIVYDISPAKAYIGGVIVVALMAGGVFFYYESLYAISSSLKFAYDIVRSYG
jgi:hypothetical protein